MFCALRSRTEEQKAQRLNACPDILQQMEADEKLLESIITKYDIMFHKRNYDLECNGDATS